MHWKLIHVKWKRVLESLDFICPCVKVYELWKKFILELLSDASKLVLHCLPITCWSWRFKNSFVRWKMVKVLFTDMFVQQVQFYFKGLNMRKHVTGSLSSWHFILSSSIYLLDILFWVHEDMLFCLHQIKSHDPFLIHSIIKMSLAVHIWRSLLVMHLFSVISLLSSRHDHHHYHLHHILIWHRPEKVVIDRSSNHCTTCFILLKL